VVGFTLIFGRVYCSFICPLGALQDLMAYVRGKIKKLRFGYEGPWTKTRFGILVPVVLILLGGSTLGFVLLDPYSLFGRIMTQLARPLVVAANNTLSFALARMEIYAIPPVENGGLHVFSFGFTLGFFILILWMSLSYGRLYCNTVCPVGTLLGILAKVSLIKIGIQEKDCTGCKRCEKVCKASCIHSETGSVDETRCVACFNCLSVCPTSAMTYRWGFSRRKTPVKTDPSKRAFLGQAALCFLSGASVLAAPKPTEFYKDSTLPVPVSRPISPPGSKSLNHFMARCTACHLCIAACPTQVLQPAFLEYGLTGLMLPRMDYQKSFCNFDCTVCTKVCPSGALLEQTLESKKQIQLGRAKFIQGNCVVYTHKTDCGACAEHCPTQAVNMVQDPEVGLRAPKIDESLCVGCGACEFACPTKPHKSIYVESNPIHLVAKKPKEEKILESVDHKSDFPF
jgi:ferredoxin